MKTHQKKSRFNHLRAWHPPADRVLALVLTASVATLSLMSFSAQAAEPADEAASSATAVNTEAPSVAGDYRLSSGDRLNIVVLDQPQLSGEFIVDGGGGILLPMAGNVSLK